MAIKLPKYQQQVSTSSESGSVRGDVGSAGSEWGAVGQFVGAATDAIGGIVKQRNEDRDETSMLRLNETLRIAEAEGNATLKTLRDEKSVEEFRQSWGDDLNSRLSAIEGGNDFLKRRSLELEFAKQRMSVNADTTRTGIVRQDKDDALVRLQQRSLDGETSIHPITGMYVTPEMGFEMATNARMNLGTVTTEQGLNDIRSFNQDLTTRRIIASSNNDLNEAEQLFEESNLTGKNLITAQDAIRDGRDRQDEGVKTQQRYGEKELLGLYNQKQLTRTGLKTMEEETVNILGDEFPKYDPAIIRTYDAALNASIDEDRTRFGEDGVPAILEAARSMANAGKRDGGAKEPTKVYENVRFLIKAGASRATAELLMGSANSSLSAYSEGREFSPEVADQLEYIATAYTTVLAEMPTRYKDASPIASVVQKIDSFIRMAETHKGHPSEKHIKEWEDDNGFTKIREDHALNEMMKRYEVSD